jgi:hypothetical protein
MRDDQHRFLQLLGQGPARLTAEQAAWVLNCQAYDVPLLVAARLLKPLGRPQPNSVKYFATVDVLAHARDPVWLTKATDAISRHWQEKNARKRERPPASELCPAVDAPCAVGTDTGRVLAASRLPGRRNVAAADIHGAN